MKTSPKWHVVETLRSAQMENKVAIIRVKQRFHEYQLLEEYYINYVNIFTFSTAYGGHAAALGVFWEPGAYEKGHSAASQLQLPGLQRQQTACFSEGLSAPHCSDTFTELQAFVPYSGFEFSVSKKIFPESLSLQNTF